MTDSSKSTKRMLKSSEKSSAENLPGIGENAQVEDSGPPRELPIHVAVVTAPTPPDPPRVVDPFDPASLRINPNTAAGAIGVKRKIVTLKVGEPDKMKFCRVHPSETYRIDTTMLTGGLQTVFGWRIRTIGGDNPRSLANFPNAGQWSGNDASGVLYGDRGRSSRVLPSSRCGFDRSRDGSHRRCGGGNASDHA